MLRLLDLPMPGPRRADIQHSGIVYGLHEAVWTRKVSGGGPPRPGELKSTANRAEIKPPFLSPKLGGDS